MRSHLLRNRCKTVTPRSTRPVIEAACWALGILMLGLHFGARAYGEAERQQAISAFAQARSAASSETVVARGPDSIVPRVLADHAPDQTTWSKGRIRAYDAQALEPLKSLPAAVLRIPRVQLEVPVYADAGERNLNRGAGLVAGTAAPGTDGNIAIAAHRDGYFRALEKVAVGDVLELETFARHRRYHVTGVAIVEPTDLWPLAGTDIPTVTLVTCYPFYFVGSAPQRYIVQAVAID